MPDGKYQYQKREGDRTLAYRPNTDEFIPIDDITEEVKQITNENRPRKEEKQAFYQERIKLVESASMSEEHKSELLQNLKESVQAAEAEEEMEEPPQPPIPGGVGYGVFYRNGRLLFTESSTLYYYIVTPPYVGASSNEWLYLTSTNRSPKGVEAFISFRQQESPSFKVFDWARSGDDRWVVSIPYTDLSNYLLTYVANSQAYPVIFVVNSTQRVEGTTWNNEVLLYNRMKNAYDRVYAHSYTLSQEDADRFLDWGPIVETFSPFPNETTRIGFFEALLYQDEEKRILTNDVTELRIDDPGFTVDFGVPNSSFIVH